MGGDQMTSMDEIRARTAERMASLKRHRNEVRWESPQERSRRQLARAQQMAHDITGGHVKRGIVNAMLALVQADERPDPKEDREASTPGARAVLPKRKRRPVQEKLW